MRARSVTVLLAVLGSAALLTGAAPAVGSVPGARQGGDVVRAGEPQTIDPIRGEPVALSCPTEVFCAAVVHDEDGPARLVNYSGGQSTMTATQDERTKTVACGTAQFCVAGPPDAAYIWDGNDWTGPRELGPALEHGPVCAPGTTTCVYVGGGASVVHDASGWHSVPLPDGFEDTFAVSCATTTFCEALDLVPTSPTGDYPAAAKAAHFDGTSWHRDADPYTTYAHAPLGIIPDEISCATPTYCLAVSVALGRVESFDGTSWTRLNEFRIHNAADMYGLTCVAPGTCFGTKLALVDRTRQRRYEGFVAYRDGKWSIELQRNVGDIQAQPCPTTSTCGAIDARLALSCPTSALCRVVDRQGDIYSIADGQWSAVDHLMPTQGTLSDVSCASRTWCMAVDSHGNALLWSDGQWSAPVKIDGNEALPAISCSASQVCVAIDGDQGKNTDAVRSGGRAIRYSSGRWHAPQVVDSGSRLQDVSCSTASRCVIVDSKGRVITRKSGGWRAPKTIAHSLATISCVGNSFCMAGGIAPHISVFVGGRWKALPHPPFTHRVLAVDCVDRRYCLASGILATYRFDSRGWRNTHAGSIGYTSAGELGPMLLSVSCGTRRFCILDWNEEDGAFDSSDPSGLIRGTHYRPLPRQATHVSCVRNMCMQVRHSVAYVLTDG
jgi:hypothetical protein